VGGQLALVEGRAAVKVDGDLQTAQVGLGRAARVTWHQLAHVQGLVVRFHGVCSGGNIRRLYRGKIILIYAMLYD